MEITHIQIESSRISQALTFALVSDLHNGPWRRIASVLEEARPDSIFLTGDIFDYEPSLPRPYQRNSFCFLKRAAAIAPSFMSIGNHEGFLSNQSRSAIKTCGVNLLDNSDVLFSAGQDLLWIGGLSSPRGLYDFNSRWTTPCPDLAFLDRFARHDGFKLLLSHHPEYYPRYIRSRSIDLTLSGHAHGGQIRLFGQGLFAPGQGILPKLTCGLYENRLIVSRGLENQSRYPRLFNPIQLIFVHLSPKD